MSLLEKKETLHCYQIDYIITLLPVKKNTKIFRILNFLKLLYKVSKNNKKTDKNPTQMG